MLHIGDIMTGAAGNAYPSGVPDFTSGFPVIWVSLFHVSLVF